ncbi:MAG: hypothetical protein M0T71_12830 [Actinomycetota bacterium]|nr:hypothetical protein [Actinomycetota bacterium]
MSPILDPLVGLQPAAQAGEHRITIGDVERQLRSLGGSAQGALQASKATASGALAVAGVALVAASYLFGRRRGKRRSSVLEIRRI